MSILVYHGPHFLGGRCGKMHNQALFAALCLCAATVVQSFHTGIFPAALQKTQQVPLLRRGGVSVRTKATSILRMAAFDAAAAKERGMQREQALEEKKRARELREREQRAVERSRARLPLVPNPLSKLDSDLLQFKHKRSNA